MKNTFKNNYNHNLKQSLKLVAQFFQRQDSALPVVFLQYI